MFFLKIRNLNIDWVVRTIHWREQNLKTALIMTNCESQIKPDKCMHQVLKESTEAFIFDVDSLDDNQTLIHASIVAKVEATTVKSVISLEA